MNLLLDTQVLVWYDSAPELISGAAMSAIQDRGNKLFFSTISIWELAIKLSVRKLTLNRPLTELVDLQLANQLIEMPIYSRHALAIESLPRIHRDPFDRMLIAQAQVEGATLVTADAVLHGYPVPTLW